MSIFKKTFSTVLCIIMMLTMLTACSKGEVEQDDTGSQTEKTVETGSKEDVFSGDPVTLKYLHWRNEDADVYRKIIQMFEEKNPDIKIDMEIIPDDQYYNVLKPRLLADDSVDIFFVHPGNANLTEIAKSGYCIELDDKIDMKDLKPEILVAGKRDGKQYAIPVSFNLFCIIYNKDIFNKYNLSVPKTYDEFISTCNILKQNSIEPVAAGFADSANVDQLFNTLMGQYTAPDNSQYSKLERGELKYTDEPIVSVYKNLADLAKNGIFSSNAAGTKYDGVTALFAQGKTGMMIAGSWTLGSLLKQNPDMNIGMFVLPPKSTQLRYTIAPGQAYSINSKSKKIDKSVKFLEFLVSKEIMTIYSNESVSNVSRKDVVPDAPVLKIINDVTQTVEGILTPNFHVTKPKLMEISRKAALRTLLGEDMNTVLQEAQEELDSVING